MRFTLSLLSLFALMAAAAPAASSLSEFSEAWAKVSDYSCSIVVHETQGSQTQDRRYDFWFKKPTFAKLEIVSGPGRGSGASWTGGDKVRGHRGGILAGIKMSVSINDAQAVSLRGDNISTASFGYILSNLQSGKGTLSEAAGDAIEGAPTDMIALKIANPAADHNVTRDVVYLSKVSHLPVRRVRYEGDTLVKEEDFVSVKLNPGLRESDF